MGTRSRCACGKVKGKFAAECNACYKARMSKLYALAQEVVSKGVCPTCGASLKRNLSLTGWWQCEQYGAEGFRKDSTKPACSFQTFTEA